MKIIYTLEFDEEKLDEWVRGLYDGDPDDPVPGEPDPGHAMCEDWVTEARAEIEQGHSVDTAFWTGKYVKSIEVRYED